MRKRFRLIIIIIFIILMTLIFIKFAKRQNINIIYPSVVHLECKNDKTITVGSGIVYDIKKGKQYIVTNYHIIKGYSTIYVHDADLNTEKATIINFDEDKDIAVLTINNALNTRKAIFDIETNTIKNEPVYVLTSVIGDDKSYIVKDALILDLKYEIKLDTKKIETIRLNYNIENGDSGSPLINKKGKVIGMIILKDMENSNNGYALPIKNVLTEVKKLEKKRNRINLGALMTNSTNIQLLEEYNLEKTNIKGVVLLSVKKGYPLDISGLLKGDIIVKFNDIVINDISDLQKELDKLDKKEIINLEYYRNNVFTKATIKLNN